MKKLSQEQLLDWLDLWIDAVPRSKQAYEQIKSLIEYADQIETTYANMADEIESSAQGPSKEWIDKKTNELFYYTDELFKWEQCRDFVCNLFKEVPIKEPSEAEIEEVATKWAHKISYSTIKEILKEYRELLRRG